MAQSRNIVLGLGYLTLGLAAVSSKVSPKVRAWGTVALGLGFTVAGLRALKEVTGNDSLLPFSLPFSSGLGRVPNAQLREANARTAGAVKRVSFKNVRNIDERVNILIKMARDGSLSPRVREKAMAVLTTKCGVGQNRRWCVNPKDKFSEAKAIFHALTDPNSPIAIRYTSDHTEVDQFHSAEKLLTKLHAGDCDDVSLAAAAMMKSVGIDPEFVVMGEKGKASKWTHIMLRVKDPLSGKSIMLDPSEASRPPGWEPLGLSKVLETGKPAGMIARAKTYKV